MILKLKKIDTMNKQFLIIITIHLYSVFISGCITKCNRIEDNELVLKFVDNLTNENLFKNINYNIDSVKIYNLSNENYSYIRWLSDSTVLIEIEEEFYPDNNYNIESVKEFYIYFSENDIDTFNSTLKINLEEECKYHILEYFEIYYEKNIYFPLHSPPNYYKFTLQKNIQNEI